MVLQGARRIAALPGTRYQQEKSAELGSGTPGQIGG
jgi:hypothetical protein